MNSLKIHITFLQDVLGSSNNNPSVLTDFGLKNAPNAEAKAEESIAVLGKDVSTMTDDEIDAINAQNLEKQTTVFPRMPDGTIFCWDYQWRGFFKEALAVGTEVSDKDLKGISKWTVRKTVDSMLFIRERRIPLLDSLGQPISKVKLFERPLRAQTMRGERICLARSETIPAGSKCSFTAGWLENKNPKSTQKITKEALIWALDYGALKGFGQWRGGSFGSFSYEISEGDPFTVDYTSREIAAMRR